jgi:cell wall-associated NlpC family hydrolase
LAAVIGLAPVVGSRAVDASARTESAAVADEAGRALDALERWHSTNRPVHYVRFLRARDQAATLLAADLGVSADALSLEWASADEAKQVAVLAALTQLGVPYRSLASEPGVGFDCSGLTTWAFEQAGIELPRTSRDQIRAADQVDRAEAEPGDLAYYPGHVSIYIGEGMMVHSPNSGNRVEATALSGQTRSFGDALTADLVVDEAPAAALTPLDGTS